MTADIAELVANIETALVDIAEKMEVAAGLESGLADLIETIKERKGLDLAPLIGALNGLKPNVIVNVPPQPAPVVQYMPAIKGEWEITKHDAHGTPIARVTLKRVA